MSRFLAAATLLAVCASAPAADDIDAQMKSVIGAYAIIEQNAADPVSPGQALYQGAIPGLLRNLDPHSVFFTPDQFEQLKNMQSSTEKGFGSVVSILPGRVIVLQTLEGTPASKAGLEPGDEILAVNGYEVARLSLNQLAQLLSESHQQQAAIVVRRAGSARIVQLTLAPQDMQSPSVDRAFFIGAGIGYIRVTSFDESTAAELKQAIERLGGRRLAGLVLDLRNNPGGLVTAAVGTASLFLQPGQKIVTLRGRHVPEKTEEVPSFAEPYEFKLAILVNGKTASAAEIVSGAMQDHDRATILGEGSFGKGLVQSVFPLSESTGLALTTALYYTPSGRSIQKPLDTSRFELGGATARPNQQAVFHTDKGRTVRGGGGIQPDIVARPAPVNRLEMALEVSGSFPDFATEYVRGNKVTADFEITPAILDRFLVFLAQRRIQPSMVEWGMERDFVSSRLLEEIFNQAIGVEKGDEVQMRRDRVVQKALEILES